MRSFNPDFVSNNAPRWRKIAPRVLTALLLLCSQQSAWAADSAEMDRWKEYLHTGEEAYQKKRWGRAEHFFAKAVREADRTDVGDKNLALSLRKLGEANTAAHKYREAEAHLQRSIKLAKDCGGDDPEAIRDLLELAKTYRSVNLEQFGKNVATVLKETGLDGIEIMNTKGGTSRVVVRFADKLDKHITSPDVNEINVEKKLTFDIHEDRGGTITLTNIKGLRLHSKVWVNLTDTSIDPNGEEGKPTALVTAEKLGLTKTVRTVLPKPVYDKIFSVVERIRHPELHSPWHKQLQERFTTSTKPKQGVPVTVTETTESASTTDTTESKSTTKDAPASSIESSTSKETVTDSKVQSTTSKAASTSNGKATSKTIDAAQDAAPTAAPKAASDPVPGNSASAGHQSNDPTIDTTEHSGNAAIGSGKPTSETPLYH